MPYRNAIEAAQARIAALENDVAQLRDVENSTSALAWSRARILEQLAEARGDLESLRKRGQVREVRLAAERDRAWTALERCLEIERSVWRYKAEAEVATARADADGARTRFQRAHEDNVRLRDRIDALETEIAALLESPARAALHYRQAIARMRAAIAAEHSRVATDDARDTQSAAWTRELERLERALRRCERATADDPGSSP